MWSFVGMNQPSERTLLKSTEKIVAYTILPLHTEICEQKICKRKSPNPLHLRFFVIIWSSVFWKAFCGCFFWSDACHLVMDLGNWKLSFGFLKSFQKLDRRQIEQNFSSFFAKFSAYLMIFLSFAAAIVMLDFEK